MNRGLYKVEQGTLAPLAAMMGRRVLPCLLVFVAVFAGVYQYVASRPDTYTSVAVVSFEPRTGSAMGAETMQVLAAKYVSFLTSLATIRRVAAESGEDATALGSAVKVEIAPATVNMTVAVTLTDAQRATRLANALSSAALRQSIGDQYLRADVTAAAVAPRFPSGPPRRLLLLVGVALGIAAAVGTSMLLDWVQRRRSKPATAGSPGLNGHARPATPDEASASAPDWLDAETTPYLGPYHRPRRPGRESAGVARPTRDGPI